MANEWAMGPERNPRPDRARGNEDRVREENVHVDET
jgi:hypothetical protein